VADQERAIIAMLERVGITIAPRRDGAGSWGWSIQNDKIILDWQGPHASDRADTEAGLSWLVEQIAAVTAARADANTDDEHDPEGATIAFERSQIAALAHQARRDLEEVESALSRLRAGTYGLCQMCERPIPSERLEARPTARTCIQCASL